MPATKYYCSRCGEYKLIPEKPSEAKKTVNIGCPECAGIRRFERLGVRT